MKPLSDSPLWSVPRKRASNGVVYRATGAGPPLLLVHGGSGSWLHWWRNIEFLARTHHVIAVDLPGYGESDDVPIDIALDEYTSLVVAALTEEAPSADTFDVVAFSFGGLIGAGVAVQLGSRVRRTALLAPSGFERPTGRGLGTRQRSAFPADGQGERDYLRHNLLALMLARAESVDDEALAIQRWNLSHSRFKNTNDQFSYSNRLPSLIRQLSGPLLLAYGEDDRTPLPSRDARIAICRQAAPQLTVEVVPGAAHWLQFEHSQATNALLDRFLAG
jgi:pimeloyl-ACP methyl ester carboxylesterase